MMLAAAPLHLCLLRATAKPKLSSGYQRIRRTLPGNRLNECGKLEIPLTKSYTGATFRR
jgi:hypothetical protein